MLQYFLINENLLANLKVFHSIKIVECVTTHSYCEVPFSNYEIWLLRAPSAPFSTSKWATYVSTYMMSASETILKNWGKIWFWSKSQTIKITEGHMTSNAIIQIRSASSALGCTKSGQILVNARKNEVDLRAKIPQSANTFLLFLVR